MTNKIREHLDKNRFFPAHPALEKCLSCIHLIRQYPLQNYFCRFQSFELRYSALPVS